MSAAGGRLVCVDTAVSPDGLTSQPARTAILLLIQPNPPPTVAGEANTAVAGTLLFTVRLKQADSVVYYEVSWITVIQSQSTIAYVADGLELRRSLAPPVAPTCAASGPGASGRPARGGQNRTETPKRIGHLRHTCPRRPPPAGRRRPIKNNNNNNDTPRASDVHADDPDSALDLGLQLALLVLHLEQ